MPLSVRRARAVSSFAALGHPAKHDLDPMGAEGFRACHRYFRIFVHQALFCQDIELLRGEGVGFGSGL